MNKEIERKFLVKDMSFITDAIESRFIKQGYIAVDDTHEVRISVREGDSYICVKSAKPELERFEYNQKVDDKDALEMFNRCKKILYKTRYIVPFNTLKLEVDVFHGKLSGLILAELELPNGRDINMSLPDWIDKEVTGDASYYNQNLAWKC